MIKTFYKKSFTLVEMLVSVAIMGLVFALLYKSVASIGTSNEFYKKKLDDFEINNQLVFLLYRDILLSTNFTNQSNKNKENNATSLPTDQGEKPIDPEFTDESKVSYLKMRSFNSIKGYINPFISYVFYKDQKILYRIETKVDISIPIRQALEPKDEVVLKYNRFNNIDTFSVNKRRRDFLIFYSQNKKEQFFEISKL